MSKAPEDNSPESWHRFFASTANNRAWQLAELSREQVDKRELLNAAHASAWHWQAIGNELNRMRALMLLAQAHALADHGQTALAYASEMRSYFVAAPGTPDWELAFVHAIHAHAAFVAGATSEHTKSYALAAQAVAAIADEEDQTIVLAIFTKVAKP